jgi:hypothetical protein
MRGQSMNNPKVFKSSGGTGGIKSTATGMGYSLVRDISNALPAILGNAVILTQKRLGDNETDLEILDTLVQFLMRMYVDARQEISGWIGGFEELYDYIEDPRHASIYAQLCTNMVLNIYAFLFTSVNNALESADSLEREDDARLFLTACMSTMRSKDRRKLFKELGRTAFPNLPVDLAYEPRRYLEEIRKYQDEVRSGKHSKPEEKE